MSPTWEWMVVHPWISAGLVIWTGLLIMAGILLLPEKGHE
jgi:hypothetical protein